MKKIYAHIMFLPLERITRIVINNHKDLPFNERINGIKEPYLTSKEITNKNRQWLENQFNKLKQISNKSPRDNEGRSMKSSKEKNYEKNF